MYKYANNSLLILSRRLTSLVTQSHSLDSQIRVLVQQSNHPEALRLYATSPRLHVTKFTFPSLLKSCVSLQNLCHGKAIHSNIVTLGLQFDPFIATSLINMYAKCGAFDSAVSMFDEMCRRDDLCSDVTVWNCIIDGYFSYGLVENGFARFSKMQAVGVRPDGFTLSILLGVCDGSKSYYHKMGKEIHGCITRRMFEGDAFLGTALIDMYSTYNSVEYAWRVFEKVEAMHNVVVWNAMIRGFCENSLWTESLELFLLMKKRGAFKIVSASYTGTLTACGQVGEADFGRQVHCEVIKAGFPSDPYVCTSLLTMYSKCRLTKEAWEVFDEMPGKGVESWNAMIAAYVCNGYAYEAIEMYSWMRPSKITPDFYTISNILSCCSMFDLHSFGRTIHGELIKRPIQSHIAIQSALVTMYSKSGSIVEAGVIFSTTKEKDLVAWGSMIASFSQNEMFKEALDLFISARKDDLIVPDSDIMASVITACMGLENKELGCAVHGCVVKIGLIADVFVSASLVDMYAKCGTPEMAAKIFSEMPYKNLVAWNSIISCYCRNGLPDLSLDLFSRITQHGLAPDSVSITVALSAVSSVAGLLKGKAIHSYQLRLQIPSDLQVENALIDTYVKCGCLKYASVIFQSMAHRNLVTWNSMISGYGCHGECKEAIKLFNEMQRCQIIPDDVTFLSLISSCSHSGLIDEGLSLFYSMGEKFHVEPKIEHCVNVVDLLGRAGRLDDAYSFIQKMPVEPDGSVWLTLLCACQVHRKTELGKLAAKNLIQLEPTRGSNYVQLLNLYGNAELWDKAAKLRASMKQMGLKKSPGCSWIEIGRNVVVFFSGDFSSHKAADIYKALSSIRRNMEVKRDFDGNMALL